MYIRFIVLYSVIVLFSIYKDTPLIINIENTVFTKLKENPHLKISKHFDVHKLLNTSTYSAN